MTPELARRTGSADGGRGRRGGGRGRRRGWGRLEGDTDDRAQSLGRPDADDAGGMSGGPAVAVADDSRREPVAGTEGARLGAPYGLGLRHVAVGGVGRGVHPAPDGGGAFGHEPGLGAGAGGLGQATAADGDHLAGFEALTGGALHDHAGGPGGLGGEGGKHDDAQQPSQGGHPYRPALHAEDLRIRLIPRWTPGPASFHRASPETTRPARAWRPNSWSRPLG